jgi:hypothetical protein
VPLHQDALGLAGVQAERAQASLVDPERHAEHAAHVQSRCFRAEPRPALVPAGVLDPEDGVLHMQRAGQDFG